MSMITKHDLPAFLAKELSNFLKTVDIIYTVVLTRKLENTTHRKIHSAHVILEQAIIQLLILCEMYEIRTSTTHQLGSETRIFHNAYITISLNELDGGPGEHCIGLINGWISLFKLDSTFSTDELRHFSDFMHYGLITYMNRAIEYAAYCFLSPAQVVPVFTEPEDFLPPMDPKLRVFHNECTRINRTPLVLDHRKKVRTHMLMRIGNIENYEYRGEKFTWEE